MQRSDLTGHIETAGRIGGSVSTVGRILEVRGTLHAVTERRDATQTVAVALGEPCLTTRMGYEEDAGQLPADTRSPDCRYL